MGEPEWIDGRWWRRAPDGSWSRWDERTSRWERVPTAQRASPSPQKPAWLIFVAPAAALLALIALFAVPILRAPDVVHAADPDPGNCDRAMERSEAEPMPVLEDPDPIQKDFAPGPGSGWNLMHDFALDLEGAAGQRAAPEVPLWRTALTQHAFMDGWKKVWVQRTPRHRNLIQDIQEFATERDAHDLHRWAVGFTCGAADSLFPVPGIPGAVGARFSYPQDGWTIDNVSFVAGRRRFVVVAGADRTAPLRAMALSVARGLRAHAAGREGACSLTRGLVDRAAAVGKRLSARGVADLHAVLLSEEPPGFVRDPGSSSAVTESVEPLPGVRKVPALEQGWSDGVHWLGETVLAFGSHRDAVRYVEREVAETCELASWFQEGAIEGSIYQVSEYGGHHRVDIRFIRGTRVYWLIYSGPQQQPPPPEFERFVERAGTLAR